MPHDGTGTAYGCAAVLRDMGPGARALPGSGLGLSIVARTVQQAGGEVALTPAEGGGTVVTIRLPGAPTPPPEDLPSA